MSLNAYLKKLRNDANIANTINVLYCRKKAKAREHDISSKYATGMVSNLHSSRTLHWLPLGST